MLMIMMLRVQGDDDATYDDDDDDDADADGDDDDADVGDCGDAGGDDDGGGGEDQDVNGTVLWVIGFVLRMGADVVGWGASCQMTLCMHYSGNWVNTHAHTFSRKNLNFMRAVTMLYDD